MNPGVPFRAFKNTLSVYERKGEILGQTRKLDGSRRVCSTAAMKWIPALTALAGAMMLSAQDAPKSEVELRLAAMEAEFQAGYRQQVAFAHELSVGELNQKYGGALTRAQEDASKRGDLEGALLFRDEKARIEAGKGVPATDEANVPTALKTLRETYRTALTKLEADRSALADPLVKAQDEKLAAYQTLLTTQGRLDDALRVKEARDALATTQQRLGDASPGAGAVAYLGHSVYEASALKKFPKNANLAIDQDWLEKGDKVIAEARRLGLKVVLGFQGKDLVEVEAKGIPLAVANSDVVIAMMWRGPYYAGFTPADLTAFGNKLHQASPRMQFWAAFVEKPRGKVQTLPVPPEVDVISVVSYFAPNAEEVRKKADDVLAGWMQKAEGRPVLFEWSASGRDNSGRGLVPQTQPGTFLAMQEARDRFKAAGLLFGHIGKKDDFEGVDSKRELIEEIEEKITLQPAASR